MESWEKLTIQTNRADLIALTKCSTGLLNRLLQQNIINEEEKGKIETICTSEGKADYLYNVLVTRVGAFEALKMSIQEDKQSGVYEILTRITENMKKSKWSSCGQIMYTKHICIGEGMKNTKVYFGRIKHLECNAAIKRINLDGTTDDKSLRELKILLSLPTHSHIVKCLHYEQSKKEIFLGLELCSYTLATCIKRQYFPMKRMKILKQITKGLKFLHLNNIVHGDLKPANILIYTNSNGYFVVKVSDFGLSKVVPQQRCSVTVSQYIGSAGWMPAEMIRPSSDKTKLHLTFATDIFPLGCIFYHVLTDGDHPFGNEAVRTSNIMNGQPLLPRLRATEDLTTLTDIISLMVSVDPKKRPMAATILKQGFKSTCYQLSTTQTGFDGFHGNTLLECNSTVHPFNDFLSEKERDLLQQLIQAETDPTVSAELDNLNKQVPPKIRLLKSPPNKSRQSTVMSFRIFDQNHDGLLSQHQLLQYIEKQHFDVVLLKTALQDTHTILLSLGYEIHKIHPERIAIYIDYSSFNTEDKANLDKVKGLICKHAAASKLAGHILKILLDRPDSCIDLYVDGISGPPLLDIPSGEELLTHAMLQTNLRIFAIVHDLSETRVIMTSKVGRVEVFPQYNTAQFENSPELATIITHLNQLICQSNTRYSEISKQDVSAVVVKTQSDIEFCMQNASTDLKNGGSGNSIEMSEHRPVNLARGYQFQSRKLLESTVTTIVLVLLIILRIIYEIVRWIFVNENVQESILRTTQVSPESATLPVTALREPRPQNNEYPNLDDKSDIYSRHPSSFKNTVASAKQPAKLWTSDCNATKMDISSTHDSGSRSFHEKTRLNDWPNKTDATHQACENLTGTSSTITTNPAAKRNTIGSEYPAPSRLPRSQSFHLQRTQEAFSGETVRATRPVANKAFSLKTSSNISTGSAKVSPTCSPCTKNGWNSPSKKNVQSPERSLSTGNISFPDKPAASTTNKKVKNVKLTYLLPLLRRNK